MLGCLKACIRHPKEKRNKARPVANPGLTSVCLPHGSAPTSNGEHVALECVAPIVEEEVSQIEEDIKAEETEDEIEEETPIQVMGMADESVIAPEPAGAATLPKERKFQVVRVPGVFSRGRWKCWDYRDDVKPFDGLTFTDEKEAGPDSAVTVTASTFVSTSVTEAASNHSPLREESSTIVVTSIAPAPPTPQHGTPSSISEMSSPPYSIIEVHHHPTTGDWSASLPTTITSTQPPLPDTVVVQSVAPPAPNSISPTPSRTKTFDFAPATASPRQKPPMPPTLSMEEGGSVGHQMSTSMTSSVPSIGGASTVSAASGGVASSMSSVSPPSIASTATPSPEMTRSGSEAAAAAPAAQIEEEPAVAVPLTNVAAIDNKIEQAMDLVKTHLTYAVREEVEILRTTISDLESRVSTLETQNAYLKRHVSPEVLASLPGMVQQHKMSLPATAAPVQLQQQAATSAPSTTVSLAAVVREQQLQAVAEAAPASRTTKPYCPATSSFVNSLNTVVSPPPNNPR